jgi:TDG/mug DNA glycosylase family protein
MTRPKLERPTPAQVAAAAGKTVPDVIAPGLVVLFCGINPGLYSAATGHHFARPGNRFWPALHRSGFTPRLLDPAEQERLLDLGLGITNLAERATAGAAELGAEELREGGERLVRKLRRYRPAWVAFLGLGAYSTAFGRRRAKVGPAAPLVEGTRAWLLPNPSGLNAHYRPPELAAAFAELRAAAGAPGDQRSAPRGGRGRMVLEPPGP